MDTARFLKYVWPFYNIMHERVKPLWNEYVKDYSYIIRKARFPADKKSSRLLQTKT